MSQFKCEVVRVKIVPHPNGDAIEIAEVGDFQSIVKKGQFKDGDLAVYIPEQAVLPEAILKNMGFWDADKNKGRLSGAAGNRVKAIKLRGVLSQGIMHPVEFDGSDVGPEWFIIVDKDAFVSVHEGMDVADKLGIVKYEPKLPSHMAGRIIGADYGATHNYDFDNLKKCPKLFEDGEEVVITEKIHGTFMGIGVLPSKDANEKYYKGRVVLFSKGMGAKGFILDHSDETNLYAQCAKKHGLLDKAFDAFQYFADLEGKPMFIMGEVFGKTMSGAGVQDLTYAGEQLDYRLFDICQGNRGSEEYFPWHGVVYVARKYGFNFVPVLYTGPYSKEKVLELTDGVTTIGASHIREGVVVKSANEVRHPRYGRKIAKSISEAYLLRKSATEYA